MTPELSRSVPAARIRPEGEERVVEATAAECARIATRLGLPAVQALTCRFRLRPGSNGAVEAEGSLRARVVQSCVVTLEDLEADVAECFVLRFVPEGMEGAGVDFDPESEDELPYEGGVIDLGEATVQQLSLALDPYPRKPGVDLPGDLPNETGEGAQEGGPSADTPEKPNPFAALARLRRPH